MKFDVLLAEHGPARKLYRKVARLPCLNKFDRSPAGVGVLS